MVGLAGLRMNGNLNPVLVPTVTFSPTLGIVAGRIDKLGLDIRSFREPLMRAIREVMVPSIRANFDAGGRPAWEPLAADTVKIRGNAGPILNRSGTLKQVATQINIWDVTTTSAVIRDLPDKAWYGKVHQGGYEGSTMKALISAHGGNIEAAMTAHTQSLLGSPDLSSQSRTSPSIPARPFLVFQPEDLEKIDAIFVVWLGERLDRSWPPGI